MTQPVRVTGANYCGCPQALFTHTRTQALVWCGEVKGSKNATNVTSWHGGWCGWMGWATIQKPDISLACWNVRFAGTRGEKRERERYVQQRETHLRRLHIKCLARFFPLHSTTHTPGAIFRWCGAAMTVYGVTVETVIYQLLYAPMVTVKTVGKIYVQRGVGNVQWKTCNVWEFLLFAALKLLDRKWSEHF